MMMMVHHDNRGRPDQRRDGGDGPTCNRPPGVAEPVAGSSSSNSTSGGSVLRGLQPFQYLSNTNTHHHNSTSLRSPGLYETHNPFSFCLVYLKASIFKKRETEETAMFFCCCRRDDDSSSSFGFSFH